jgi:hypothetical protein
VPDKVQKIKTEVVTREQISNEENIHEAAAFKI